MTDIGLVKEQIEANIAEAEAMCEELKKSSTATLVNSMIAWYEGQMAAYNEVLDIL